MIRVKIDKDEYEFPKGDIITLKKMIAVNHGVLDSHIYLTIIDSSYKVEFLKNEVRNIDEETLTENLSELSKKYGDKNNIIAVWMIENNEDEYRDVDKDIIIDYINAEKFKQYLEKELKNYKLDIDNIKSVSDELEKIKPVPISEFNETKSDFILTLEMKKNIRLVDIFDSFSTSDFLPFIKYQEDRVFYKISENYLKTSDINITANTKKRKYIFFRFIITSEPTYAVWDDKNKVHFFIKNYGSFDKNGIIKNFFSMSNIDPTIIKDETTSIGGTFEVEIEDFKRIVFADLVFNNDIVSQRFFLNEQCLAPSGCTLSGEKERFYVMFGDKNINQSLTFSISSEENKIKITVQKSRSKEQLNSFLEIFSIALGVYNKEKNKIIKDYEYYGKYLKDFSIDKDKNIKKQKEEIKKGKEETRAKEKIKQAEKRGKAPPKKTKGKLSKLQEFDPELFKSPFYGREVQEKDQPNIITDKREAKEYEDKYGSEKILKFTDIETGKTAWYTCKDPNPYPGLKTKIGSTKNLMDDVSYQKWAQNRKGLPKCFKKEQSRKGMITPSSQKKKSSYVQKKSHTIIGEDALSEIPQNLQYIFPGYYKEGSPKSNNTFIYCVLKALGKKDVPSDLRKKLASLNTELNIVKQSLPTEDVKEYIQSSKYFDPTIFLELLEYYFQVNIFLYSGQDSKGNILVPQSIGPYISFKKQYSKSIGIICYKEPLGYHCELITKDSKAILDKETEKRNIEVLEEYLTQILVGKEIRKVSLRPVPLKLLKGLVSQGLDENGRVYAINYNNYSIFVSPTAPFPIPIGEPKKTSFENIPEFLKEIAIGITKDKKGLILNHPSFLESYIPLKDEIEGQIIDLTIFEDTQRSKNTSKIISKNRVIANMLKEYVLYIYANYGNVIINVDDIKLKPKNNFKNITSNTLIVPNKIIKKRLEYYLKTMIFNLGEEEIQKQYQNKEYIHKLYENVSDFKMRIGERLFTNEYQIAIYIQNEKVPKYEILSEFNFEAIPGYFFSNSEFVKGSLCIIQNVFKGEKALAITVADEWRKTGINIGYYVDVMSKTTNVREYDYNDFKTFSLEPKELNIIKNGNRYSAVLFL